uniref:Tubulin alpha-2 chain-like n=1 Tax=Callorhinchus milii TaxID=7868 RepID=A0A4W3GZF8_CALMI
MTVKDLILYSVREHSGACARLEVLGVCVCGGGERCVGEGMRVRGCWGDSETLANTQYWSTALLAVARGASPAPGPGSGLSSLYSLRTRLSRGYNCVTWNPRPVEYWSDPKNIIDVALPSRSLTVCANHSSVAEYMQHVVGRARAMYQAGAYLHWYWRHGCEESDFLQAFQQLSCVEQEYSTAVGS